MLVEQTTIPFYTDWKFWSFVASAVAIALSQLPPIHILFRRARLGVEAYSQVLLTHKFGNPNAQLHLIISNSGGRKVRIKELRLTIKPKSGQPFVLPAKNYFQNQSDKETILFVPFSLSPGEEWAHIVCFFPSISRQDEKKINDWRAALREDIIQKRANLTEPESKKVVQAESNLVRPFEELFERQFKWQANEFELVVSATTDPRGAMVDEQFRFVVYESDSLQLRSVVREYPTGGGIYFSADAIDGVSVPIESTKSGN